MSVLLTTSLGTPIPSVGLSVCVDPGNVVSVVVFPFWGFNFLFPLLMTITRLSLYNYNYVKSELKGCVFTTLDWRDSKNLVSLQVKGRDKVSPV